VSFGICVGAALLLSAAYFLVAYIRRRRQDPGGVYLRKFKRMILDMKEVIELGEKTEGLYANRNDNCMTRDHILYLFRHIDKLGKDGALPPLSELDDGGRYAQMLVNVIPEREAGRINLFRDDELPPPYSPSSWQAIPPKDTGT
jgi:hypothetical protein